MEDDRLLRGVPLCRECWAKLFGAGTPPPPMRELGSNCVVCDESAGVAYVKCRISLAGEATIEAFDPDAPPLLDLDRLMVALAYATGALTRTRAPTPSQLDEDRRFAKVCWRLAEQVTKELDRRIAYTEPKPG